MNNNSNQWFLFSTIGVLLIAAAFFVNQWTVAAWLSYGGTLRLFDRIVLWVIDLCFLGGGVFLVYKRHALSVGKAEIGLLGITFLLLVGGSEGAARILDAAHGYDFLQNKQRAERGIIPFRMFGPKLYTQEAGMRYILGRHGEKYPFIKAPGTFRVVAMGGSTTQDLVKDMHYPKRLEELLREAYPNRTIEVINTGNSGYATPHLLILLSLDVLSWNPDLIIASENVNDLLAAYFPDFTEDYSNKYSNEMFLPHPSLSRMLLGWSRLYWVVRSRVDALSYRILESQDAVYIRKSYGISPPTSAEAVFRRNWETFANIVNGRGIPLVLASQPLEPSEEYWDRHMRYKSYNDVAAYPLHAEFLLHHAAYNTTIKEVAEERNVYFLDNAALFTGRTELFSDFVHYTNAGIEELAQNYAQFIKHLNVIK